MKSILGPVPPKALYLEKSENKSVSFMAPFMFVPRWRFNNGTNLKRWGSCATRRSADAKKGTDLLSVLSVQKGTANKSVPLF
ncbi:MULTISPECIES: hypothetical protein [unclassified Pseudomonas]|uniref:hypothetical protein n=1 Tax=unclassified Pseudomonas TaxID=196821 RepID=UPI00111C555C|nr:MULTISPECIES: hypothetical protein [unclassified Pseudomonas]